MQSCGCGDRVLYEKLITHSILKYTVPINPSISIKKENRKKDTWQDAPKPALLYIRNHNRTAASMYTYDGRA